MSHTIYDYEDSGEGTGEQTVYQPPPPPKTTNEALFACPDCSHKCSKYAEACPACGRFFRGYDRTLTVIPGAGWIGKVAWGVVVSSFLWGAILMGLFMLGIVLLVVLFGVGTALTPPR